MDDIAPELYGKLKRGFEARMGADRGIAELDAKIADGDATYRDAEDYAVRVGNALAGSFRANLSSDVLPDGKMYYNIATRTVDPLLREDYLLVSAAAARTQEALNRAAGIGLKSQTAALNEDRIDGIIERLTAAEQYDDIAWILDRPVVNFSQSVVDDTIEANADFHAKAGLNPKIVRECEGQACAWCAEMAGTYDYPAPKDVYRRHQGCTCVVEYYPGDGRIQNAHTKKWREAQREQERRERIDSARMTLNLDEKALEKMRESAIMKSEEMRVYTSGKRNEIPLTDEQFNQAKRIAEEYGYDSEILYSDDSNTSIHNFLEGDDIRFLVIGTDVIPAQENGGTANERISMRGCIAHEVVGHYEAFKRGTTQISRHLEEAQASLRAAKFAPGLSDEEREILKQDAQDRLTAVGLKLEDVEDQLDVKER